MDSQSFPKTISAVTVDWLNQVLPGNNPVAAFELSDVEEQGVTSQVFVLNLSFAHQQHHLEPQLLIKFSTENEEAREALRGGHAFRREVDFYQKLGEEAGIPIPHCYASGYDDSDNTFMLLLEFLKDSSVRDIVEGTIDEVKLVVEHVALMHSKWWGRTEELSFIESEHQDDMLQQRVERLKFSLDNIKTNYAEKVGSTIISMLELYIPNAELISKESMTGPLTLCHSDFHRQQLLFPKNDQGKFCVIDWQTVSIDRGATDLSRIITTGLRAEDRREYEVKLVERYHEILIEQGVKDYPIEELWKHYRLGVAKVLIIHALAFAGFDLAPLMAQWEAKGMDWFEVFYGWPTEAGEDHDILNHYREFIASLKDS